jgi:hypothetical protein
MSRIFPAQIWQPSRDFGSNFLAANLDTLFKRCDDSTLSFAVVFFSLYPHIPFVYESQKKYRQSKGDFEVFCRKIGWTTKDGDVERKKRWFGASEFIYDVKKAPEGHLPLTSALRGTSLIKFLLDHPVWENDDWKNEP